MENNSETNGEQIENNNKNVNNANKVKNVKKIIGDKPQTAKFIPPTIEQVQEYCTERNNTVDAEKFVNHYAASNWFRGKTKIKNWKACVITWEKNDKQQPTYQKPKGVSFDDID